MSAPRRSPVPLDHYKLEHVTGKFVSEAADAGKPWLAWAGAPLLAALLHWRWPGWLAPLLVLACSAGVAAGAWKLTHERDGWHARLLSPLSVAAAGCWLCWASAVGVNWSRWFPLLVWLVAGGSLCWHWSHWLHEHESAGLGKALRNAFAVTGVHATKVIKAERLDGDEGQGIEGELVPPAGYTHDEFSKIVPNVTAAAHLPPGALTTAPHPKDAGRVLYSLTNPLLLEGVQPWPGPSIPKGGSAASPVRVGVYSNGKPVRLVLPNHSRQVMGMTNAGKSFGWWWNEAAELFTRRDAAGFGADVTKADQTLGPMREGLHAIAITRDEVAALLEGWHRAIPARTAFLTARGYNRWVAGCGLTYCVIDLEETPDIVDLLDDAELLKMWISDVKAIRSSGGSFDISLQRSTFDQLPTIVRGQLAKICFGVESSSDADFGLSDAQIRRNCHPGDWQAKYPGKFYLDAPGVPDELLSMEARTYGWGNAAVDGGQEGSRMMRAHCASYPAKDRPLDEITAAALAPPPRAPSAAPPTDPPRPRRPAMAAAPPREDDMRHGKDDDDDLSDASLARDLKDAGSEPDIDVAASMAGGEWELDDAPGPAVQMSREAALELVDAKLAELRGAGRQVFGLEVWVEVLERTGKSEAWLREVLARLEAERRIKARRTRPRTWEFAA